MKERNEVNYETTFEDFLSDSCDYLDEGDQENSDQTSWTNFVDCFRF